MHWSQVLKSAHPITAGSGSSEETGRTSADTSPCGPCEDGLVKNPNTNVDLNAKCVAPPACGSSAYNLGGTCKRAPLAWSSRCG